MAEHRQPARAPEGPGPTTPQTRLRAFFVDDEELALRRLSRMLEETCRVEITGTSMDPIDALSFLSSHASMSFSSIFRCRE